MAQDSQQLVDTDLPDEAGAAEAARMAKMAQNNKRALKVLTASALAMLGLGFASKPLYDTFCRVTGYGGTTRVATVNENAVTDRIITVQFDSNTAKGLGWDFGPEQRSMDVRVGANGLAFYHATNNMDVPVIATSNYNVSPIKAAPYFSKLECFCFTEQRLEPGESAEFPVVFFIDPLMIDDNRLDDVKTITLSYTFFPLDTAPAALASQTQPAEALP